MLKNFGNLPIKKYLLKKNINKNINELLVNDKSVKSDKIITNEINSFFSNVGKNLNKKKKKKNNFIHNDNTNYNSCSFFINATDENEIRKVINNLDIKKAGPVDGISNKVIKCLIDFIVKPLEYIFDLAISEVVFPTHFKKTIIVPIYKSGEKKLITNYRPISLTSGIAKIFEKILKCRLVTYINKYNLISNRQFVFQTGISANDAIAHVTEYIYEKLDQSLKPLGMVNGVYSDTEFVTFGVRQVSVLGPTLFNLVINF